MPGDGEQDGLIEHSCGHENSLAPLADMVNQRAVKTKTNKRQSSKKPEKLTKYN